MKDLKMMIIRDVSLYIYLYKKKPFYTTLHPLRGDTGYLLTFCWENLDPGHRMDLTQQNAPANHQILNVREFYES